MMGEGENTKKCPFCGKMNPSGQSRCECGYYFYKEQYQKSSGALPVEEPKLGYWQKVVEFAKSYHHYQNLGFISLVGGYILGLFLAPLQFIDEKRIRKFEEKRDIKGLLNFVFTINKGYLWEKACQAVARLGAEAIPFLTEALKPEFKLIKKNLAGTEFKYNSTPHVRATAAYCLGLIGDPATVEKLEELLKDNDLTVVRLSREAIEKIKEI